MNENYIAFLCAAILSAASNLSIICIYYRYPVLHIFAFKLVRDLAFLDLFTSLSWMIPSEPIEACILQGVLQTIGGLSTVLWTGVISTVLYTNIVKNRKIDEKVYERYSISLVCLVSISFSLMPFVSYSWNQKPYGKSGDWCWIVNDEDANIMWIFTISIFYGPFLFVLCYNIILNFFVIRRINFEFRDIPQNPAQRALVYRLVLYPVVLIVSYIPALIFRLHEIFDRKDQLPEFFVFFAGVCGILNGFFNSIIYGCTKAVKDAILNNRYSRNELLLD